MPYTLPKDRVNLDKLIEPLVNELEFLSKHEPISSLGILGHLNYVITRLLIKTCPAKKYWAFVLVIGTLFMVAFEFYRRVCVPYEDQKKEENGDVGYGEIGIQ